MFNNKFIAKEIVHNIFPSLEELRFCAICEFIQINWGSGVHFIVIRTAIKYIQYFAVVRSQSIHCNMNIFKDTRRRRHVAIIMESNNAKNICHSSIIIILWGWFAAEECHRARRVSIEIIISIVYYCCITIPIAKLHQETFNCNLVKRWK